MFKNLQIYRLPAPWNMTAAQLGERLEQKRFQPCGTMDMQSSGWAPPREGGEFVHAVQNQWLISLCTESRILPSSVINQATQERAAEIEGREGCKPGRKQMKEIKEMVTQELIPRAFSTKKSVAVWIDPRNGWLVIDTSSPAKADHVIGMLSKALDDIPVSLLRTEVSPATAMSAWLIGDEMPGRFTVDRDCELKACTEEKSSVRYAHHPLDVDDVRQHITDGKQPTRLAMTWSDRLSFVITDKFQIKKLAFLDIVMEEAEQAETAEEMFDANFAIAASELSRFLPDLVDALGGEVVPAVSR